MYPWKTKPALSYYRATLAVYPSENIFSLCPLLYLAYGSKEKTNTGWKFLNNYIYKKEKQGDKAKNKFYKFVAYNIKWMSESRCVKPDSCTVMYVIS